MFSSRRLSSSAFKSIRGPRSGLAVAAALFILAGPDVAGEARADTGASSQSLLSGEALRKVVSGRRIYLAVPLGGELPLFYRPDGHLDGSGEAAGLGRFLAPSDSGRWWVDGNRICQKWQSWYDGKTFCFTLKVLAGDHVAWDRDDGQKGIARIGP